ncbi:bacteriohemerythrin [Candidatus Magnetomonas plexicatena]|uniref:bacteriohemerythrin n=1 Tax=Candidatus Magnetomonas plexicatena TaxID=2552947 RepID=UPI001C787656|nr:hemerythrin family protein [Nitrospirales bacterium LBB_01]QWR76928.1 hemerythrin family protein [Nitrospirales bacterium LBB_01]
MEIYWDESLSTGVDTIDKQHKEIIARINALLSMSDEEKEGELDKILRFFGGYVIDHFNTEEAIMIKHKYPQYDEHKGEHMKFLKSYSSLKRLFEKEGATELIITATQNQAVDWLIKHIMNTDQKMADFIRNKI